MLKRLLYIGCAAVLLTALCGCKQPNKEVKIGVSFGIGDASRWEQEKTYMEDCAKGLGANIEIRMNKTDEPKTQQEDCFEMIDGGIDVLIFTPRDIENVKEIVEYANKNGVKIVNYARVASNESIDLFVGYDSGRMGQMQGQYLSETVFKGDYIVLRGDDGDGNASLLYKGAMRYITPLKGDINILADEMVADWSTEEAKKIVLEVVAKNGNQVDAILAPNDRVAGACAEVLSELGITKHVAITGMDAEIDAIKRIVAGTQDVTIYMDLERLANTAVNEAYHMATGQKININTKFDNGTKDGVDANLLTGKLITKNNLDKVLIEPGYFTREEIYGTP